MDRILDEKCKLVYFNSGSPELEKDYRQPHERPEHKMPT